MMWWGLEDAVKVWGYRMLGYKGSFWVATAARGAMIIVFYFGCGGSGYELLAIIYKKNLCLLVNYYYKISYYLVVVA